MPADRANVYDPATRSLVRVGTNGIPRGGYGPDRNNWAPRIGLAWRPGQRGTVLRAGYGLYYDQGALATGEGLYFNAPYFDFKLYFPLAQLPLTLYDPFPRNFPLPCHPPPWRSRGTFARLTCSSGASASSRRSGGTGSSK